MKSKNLLLALALPVAFAACTADDFITEQSGNPALAGRKVVGNITFVAPNNADTRLIWEDNRLKWTDTDKLGAALMDAHNGGTDADPTKNYTIGNALFSNYRYDYVNGDFTNDNATFVEGNYFVYAQFKAVQKRTGLAYLIPAVQESGVDGRDSWYNNQMWLDHIFVSEGNSQVEVNPLPVFPTVSLKAKYEGAQSGVVIKKIVVTDATEFGNEGTVQPLSVPITAYDALVGLTPVAVTGKNFDAADYKVSGSASMDKVFNAYKKAIADFGTVYTVAEGKTKSDIVNPNIADYFKADNKKSPNLALKYTTEAANVAGVMVVPQQATAHTAGNLKFEIYTNKGLVTIAGTANGMSNAFALAAKKDYVTTPATGADDTLLKNKAANAIRYDAGISTSFLAVLTAGQTKSIEFGFKDDAILVPNALTVSNTEELKDYLTNWYTGKKGKIVGGTFVTITASPASVGESVDIDNEVLAFMANAANPELKFAGTVTIPAGTAANALDKITKGGSNLDIINKTTLTWIDNTKTFTSITNEGTLTVGEAAGKAIGFTGVINNMGTLTLQGDVVTVTNGSNGKPANNTAIVTLKKGATTTLTNHAVVSVEGAATVAALINNNSLTVKSGTLTTDGASTNTANITVAKDATWSVEGSFTNLGNTANAGAGTVTNNGTITVTAGQFVNAVSTASGNTANGKVVNNGQIACSGSGAFTNNADMDASAGSITLITTNAATAEIVVADGVGAINVPTNNGKITYIVGAQGALKTIPTAANSLRITATVDFKDLSSEEIDYVEFRSTASMIISDTSAKGKEKATFANVIFNGGTSASKVLFTINNKLVASKILTIAKNAKIIINTELEFASTDGGDFKNDGSILIVGTLNFSGIEVGSKDTVTLGDYLFTGGSASNITWKKIVP